MKFAALINASDTIALSLTRQGNHDQLQSLSIGPVSRLDQHAGHMLLRGFGFEKRKRLNAR